MGEAALDIEDVIGLAPQADIAVYQAPNSLTGLLDEYDAIAAADPQVVSTSWGLCEADAGSAVVAAEGTTFEQMAAQGESVFAAAGDAGSEDCSRADSSSTELSVDDPASQPDVTGVGGLTLAPSQPAQETVWNDSSTSAGAGGGGISSLHAMPTYQAGAPSGLDVVNAHSSGAPCGASTGYCREVPDVSADADPYSGYTIYWDGSWTAIGGTSAAAPLWGALAALVDADPACGGTTLGFANRALYAAAAETYAGDFYDVTSGDNDYLGAHSGLFPAGTAYDMASGLGAPNGAALASTLCGVSVANPGNQATTVGSPVHLQASAIDPRGLELTWTASGLPAGLSISSSGLITGSPAATGSSSVTLTATDTAAAHGSATFTWSVERTPPANVSQPVVSGVAAVGRALMTTTGSWTGSPTGFTYRWQECTTTGTGCAEIPGATGSSYLPDTGDAGHTIRSVVVASNAGGPSRAAVSAPTAVVVPVPVATEPPAVTGVPAVGRKLSATRGTWNTPVTVAYQWLRCNAAGGSCTAITDATTSTRVLSSSDLRHAIEVKVSATNAAGTTVAASAPTHAVVGRPAVQKKPRISGKATVKRRLSARKGRWSGPPSRYSYQWLRCNARGQSCKRIAHATKVRYRVTKRDARHRLRVRVTARNAAGKGTATSRPSRVVPRHKKRHR